MCWSVVEGAFGSALVVLVSAFEEIIAEDDEDDEDDELEELDDDDDDEVEDEDDELEDEDERGPTLEVEVCTWVAASPTTVVDEEITPETWGAGRTFEAEHLEHPEFQVMWGQWLPDFE